MTDSASERRTRLLPYFWEEAAEYLDLMEAGLLRLDPARPDPDTLNSIFRAVHSIKGSSSPFGFDELSDLAHRCESLLDEVREGTRELDREATEALLESCDCMRAMVEALRGSDAADPARAEAIAARLDALLADASPQAAAPETSLELGHLGGMTGRSIRVNTEKVDELLDMVGELVITQTMLQAVRPDSTPGGLQRFERGLAQLARNTRDLQQSVMRIRMRPIGALFSRLPRIVHDLCGKLGKNVALELNGEQTELDKTALEKIADPLMHLVRNALDHGIEAAAERRRAGKPERARIRLDAYHRAGSIFIEVSDDGAGLSHARIRARAESRRLIADGEALSDEQVHALIFQPGFSTADDVTEVSGRGVGMDVVAQNVAELGGNVAVQSREGEGTRFVIRLPLTLATLDGQLVRVGTEVFVVPTVSIVRSIRIEQPRLHALPGRIEIYRVQDEAIPVVRLAESFGLESGSTSLEGRLLMVVEGANEKAGLVVDEILGQQQVVIKSLDANYRRVQGLAGATILGQGAVALILDVAGIVEGARVGGPPRMRAWEVTASPGAAA